MNKDSQVKARKQRFSATLDSVLSNLSNTGRGYKQAIGIAFDSVVVMLSLWAAYTLRLGDFFNNFEETWYLFVVMPVVTAAIFSGLGVYRWVVRSTNPLLFRQLIKGAVVSSFSFVLVTYLLPPAFGTPRSIFIIYAALLLIGCCGIRMVWQGFFQDSKRGEPIAVFGAGAAGRQFVDMLVGNGTYRPVVFIDDDPAISGSTLSGLPILDSHKADLRSILGRYEVNRIVLAMPSLGGSDYQQALSRIQHMGIPVQTLPSICLLYTSPSPRDRQKSRMPSSA